MILNFSREFVIKWKYVRFDQLFSQLVLCLLIFCRSLFVNRWQNYETLFISFDKSIERVMLVLIELYLLSDALKIKQNGRVTDCHLECHFSNFLYEIYYLLIKCWNILVCFFANAEYTLDLFHLLLIEWAWQTLLMNLSPISLISLPQYICDGSV